MVISICLKKLHRAAINTWGFDWIRMFSLDRRRDS
jgi:hypothetical protein